MLDDFGTALIVFFATALLLPVLAHAAIDRYWRVAAACALAEGLLAAMLMPSEGASRLAFGVLVCTVAALYGYFWALLIGFPFHHRRHPMPKEGRGGPRMREFTRALSGWEIASTIAIFIFAKFIMHLF